MYRSFLRQKLMLDIRILMMIERILKKFDNYKDKIKYTAKNAVYVLLWAVVSLVSSFNQIIPSFQDICSGKFSAILGGDFYTDIVAPLLIWIVAFFVDTLYQLWTVGKNEELNKCWIKLANGVICSVFGILVFGIFYHDTDMQKTISVIGLFASVILLKISSLYVISPSFEIEKR